MEIEELFQVFAQSFIRFERDLLDVTFEFTYADTKNLSDDLFLSNTRNRLNVSIITILTSYKSYDDQSDRILSSSSYLDGAKKINQETRRKIFDTYQSYRICSKLRDYAQHQALPLGGFSIGGKANIAFDADGNLQKLDSGFNVSPFLNASKFKKSSQCKSKLRAEIENLNFEKIDIKWLIRSFAGAMYERHSALREFLKPAIITAGEKIAAAYVLASATKGSEAHFLELHGKGDKRPMRNDLSAKVLRTFETHTSLKHAIRSYVTSQITPDASTYSGQN